MTALQGAPAGARDVVHLRAPAKVNLYLQVLGRRADGFHELVTVLHAIDLCDELSLQRRQRRRDLPGGAPDVSLRVDGDAPAGEQNLAHRAACALLAEAGAAGDVGLDITLRKHIPAGGGLGGGSSDAAAVLAGLDALLGRPCRAETLQRLAASLGSDVAFFLHGGTALCTGRGEIVRPLRPPRAQELTLALPPFGVSTASVYAALAAGPAARADLALLDELAQRVADADARGLNSLYRNDLEPPARRVEPRLAALLDSGLHLSGSGSTHFAYGRREEFTTACPSTLICYVKSTSGKD